MLQTRIAALLLLASSALIGCGTAPGRVDNPPGDVAAVMRIVESFRTSIINKDKAAFMSLFFSDKPEAITWQAVVDDPSLEQIRLKRPQAIKARQRPDNNFVAFIDGIVASKTTEEEKFSDVRVDTDGEVASVSFDYVYLSNAEAANSGREKWLLVRTEQGWKIVSVVYTIRPPKPEGG
jgi:hypothetical protein